MLRTFKVTSSAATSDYATSNVSSVWRAEPRYSLQVCLQSLCLWPIFISSSCLYQIISYRPSTFWPLKVCKNSQSTSPVPDSALSVSWWHGWNSGQHRVSWDWTVASGNRRIRILSRGAAGSLFHCAGWSHLQERKRGIVSVCSESRSRARDLYRVQRGEAGRLNGFAGRL